jgi:hypothetical protein
MRDVNIPLRKAYLTTLSGITFNGVPVPVYYSYLPGDLEADNYILYGNVNNSPAGTMTTHDTFSSMRVTVYTKANGFNDGNAADLIGGEVLQRLLTTPFFNLSLPPGTPLQVMGTTLESDILQDWNTQTSRIYIDRIFIFRHTIFQQ